MVPGGLRGNQVMSVCFYEFLSLGHGRPIYSLFPKQANQPWIVIFLFMESTLNQMVAKYFALSIHVSGVNRQKADTVLTSRTCPQSPLDPHWPPFTVITFTFQHTTRLRLNLYVTNTLIHCISNTRPDTYFGLKHLLSSNAHVCTFDVVGMQLILTLRVTRKKWNGRLLCQLHQACTEPDRHHRHHVEIDNWGSVE